MKITEYESGRAGDSSAAENKILPADFRTTAHQTNKRVRAKTSREEAIDAAKAAVALVPDVREDVVSSLKARIESGQYNVDASEIADMMIRRMKADQIR